MPPICRIIPSIYRKVLSKLRLGKQDNPFKKPQTIFKRLAREAGCNFIRYL